MLRLPTWTWAMLFVLIAPLNYFAFREGYRGTDVMWSENIFLVFLSALIAWNFCFVFKNRELIFSRLPAWLRPYGVRFVVYFAAAMALSGVVSVLPSTCVLRICAKPGCYFLSPALYAGAAPLRLAIP
jgi:hypothetical protein